MANTHASVVRVRNPVTRARTRAGAVIGPLLPVHALNEAHRRSGTPGARADERPMRLASRAAVLAVVVCAVVPGVAAAACTPKSNLEAIIDDSGSMFISDQTKLRVAAMDLLIDTQGNEKRTLGAVEFGTDATPLFG